MEYYKLRYYFHTGFTLQTLANQALKRHKIS
jgi:hypothetical protein